MDLERLKKTAENATNKYENDEKEAQFIVNDVFDYWKHYTISLVNSINDAHLDDVLDRLIGKNPNQFKFILNQSIVLPHFILNNNFHEIRYNYYPNVNNSDLWKNDCVRSDLTHGSLIRRFGDTFNIFDSNLVLDKNVAFKYIEEILIPRITNKLEEYGLKIVDINHVNNAYDIKLIIIVKNPVL